MPEKKNIFQGSTLPSIEEIQERLAKSKLEEEEREKRLMKKSAEAASRRPLTFCRRGCGCPASRGRI